MHGREWGGGVETDFCMTWGHFTHYSAEMVEDDRGVILHSPRGFLFTFGSVSPSFCVGCVLVRRMAENYEHANSVSIVRLPNCLRIIMFGVSTIKET